MGAPRWAQAPDSNQKEIADALEKTGCWVHDISRVGGGLPDLMVWRAGRCYLLECKTSKGKLNKKQAEFHKKWTGCTFVVRTPVEALKAVGLTNG